MNHRLRFDYAFDYAQLFFYPTIPTFQCSIGSKSPQTSTSLKVQMNFSHKIIKTGFSGRWRSPIPCSIEKRAPGAAGDDIYTKNENTCDRQVHQVQVYSSRILESTASLAAAACIFMDFGLEKRLRNAHFTEGDGRLHCFQFLLSISSNLQRFVGKMYTSTRKYRNSVCFTIRRPILLSKATS